MKRFYIFIIVITTALLITTYGANSAGAYITSFEVMANETISPGDNITVTVRGTPGSQVWIEITNLPIKIYLPETSSGVYQGIYTLTAGLPSVYRTTIFAHLLFEGVEATPASAKEKITIIGKGPLFYNLMPADEAMVKDLRPTVYAAINPGNSKIDSQSLRIVVNNQDVTRSHETVVNPEYITFMPSSDLKEGENRIYIYGKTTDGLPISIKWKFFIKLSSSISSVSHNATKNLAAGDVLEVHLIGDPYQKAYFDIGDWKKGIPMEESFRSPGTYIGKYTIQQGDYIVNTPITGYLDLKGGATVSLQSSSLLSVLANDLVVKINQPKNGDMVSNLFILQGQTRPLTNVRVEIQVSYDVPGMGSVTTGIVNKNITSNTLGAFEYKVTLTDIMPGAEYRIIVTAIDAQGKRSSPDIVNVYQK